MESAAQAAKGPVSVILSDDHALVRQGLRNVLERDGGEFSIVAEVADVPDMIREVRTYKPDLLTLDLTMPGGSSLAALPSCFIAHPTLTVAVFTMREDPDYARQAVRAGVRAYVLKEAEPTEILKAFRMALGGETYLDPHLGLVVQGDEVKAAPAS